MFLIINFEKTFFVPFLIYGQHLPNYNSLTIKNTVDEIDIKLANHMKYLGIVINGNLKWDKLVENITKTLRFLLFKFKYLSSIVDQAYLRILYHSFVELRMRYPWMGRRFTVPCVNLIYYKKSS